MDVKPGDFFLGLMDFFTILLPGALLAYLVEDFAGKNIFGPLLPPIHTEVQGWVVFLLASYLLGQFLFLIGATFMDRIYDKTFLAAKRKNGDLLYEKAKELTANQWHYAGVRKWASTVIRLRSADAALQMDQLEATSKFFRSVFVVLIIYFIYFTLSHRSDRWIALGVVASLLVLSFWRFAEQRWKLTELTYLFYLQVCALPIAEVKKSHADSSPSEG